MRLARTTPQDDAPDLMLDVVVPAAPPAALSADPGIEQLFLAFYERMHDRARNLAERYLSRDEARDATQEAWLQVWVNWRKLRPDQRPEGFFLSIVYHKVFDIKRVDSRLESLDDVEEQLDQRAFRATDAATRHTTPADRLDLALASLTPKCREVYLLAREHRFTYKEVATVMRVSEGTVNSYMARASARVREAFAGTRFLEDRSHD